MGLGIRWDENRMGMGRKGNAMGCGGMRGDEWGGGEVGGEGRGGGVEFSERNPNHAKCKVQILPLQIRPPLIAPPQIPSR